MRHGAGRHRRRSTNIRDYLEAATRQSQVWWSTATRRGETVGGGEAESRQTLSVAFVALQVVGKACRGRFSLTLGLKVLTENMMRQLLLGIGLNVK